MNIITYLLSSGEITRCGTCPEEDFDLQADENEGTLEGIGAPETHYVCDGLLVPYTTAQAAAKANRPPYFAEWSNDTFSWVDSRPLSLIRDAKWEEIKNAREEACVAPLLDTPYGVFDGDAKSVAKIESTLVGLRDAEKLGMLPESITWTLADDSAVSLTPDQLSHVGVLLLLRGNAAHDRARVLRELIYNSSREELEDIVF